MKHAHTLVTPSPTLRAQRAGVSHFLGKGAGGTADQGNPARVSGTRGASGAPAVTKGCA